MKLIVLDIDGVLSPGEAHAFDLTIFKRLAALNTQAQLDSARPAVTLNTGRPSAYVEAVMQAINGRTPALYESGAGLYFPGSYQFRTTPLLTRENDDALQDAVQRIDAAVVQSGQAYWQPGKTVCYTLFAHPPLTIADFSDQVQQIVDQISDQFIVTPAKLALNIHPRAINKGTGLAWLAQETDIDPADMAGAGDTTGDIDFLSKVGFAAAPSNATADVKAIVSYVSPKTDAAGLHDILDYWHLD